MNFVKTIVAKADYKEKIERNGLTIVHLDPVEDGENIKCIETIVTSYDKEAINTAYKEWKTAVDNNALAKAKDEKIREIKAYDVSDNVNQFLIEHDGSTLKYWLPAAQRVQLKGSITSWKESHDTYQLDLREYYTSLNVDCEKLLTMLSDLEDYTVKCYNKTSDHINAINACATVEEVEAYDYTKDYPEICTYTL